MTLDLSDDYQIFDNTEEVILTIRRKNSETQYRVKNALQHGVDRRASFFAGVNIIGDEIVWQLPVEQIGGDATFPGRSPWNIQPGDIIRDSRDVRYSVITAGLQTLKTRWQCVTRVMPE